LLSSQGFGPSSPPFGQGDFQEKRYGIGNGQVVKV